MPKYKRIMVLMHEDLVPPDPIPKDINWDTCEFETEYHVISTLKKMGYEVFPLGVGSDLKVIRTGVEKFKPKIVFNLLVEFDGEALFDQNVVSYLELLKIPYTGCNPRGLILSRDKALAKKILSYHRIKAPKFKVFLKSRKPRAPKGIQYPQIVKCLAEEASMGISKASVVNSDEKLIERVKFIHESLGMDAIAEDFVEGREIYVGVMGNQKLDLLPPWELFFEKNQSAGTEIYTERAKFNEKYRKERGVKTGPAKLPDELIQKIYTVSKRVYKALELNGYARIDFRLNANNEIFILEANPNPDIAKCDEFALSAKHLGIKYEAVLEKIIRLGIRWAGKQ